MTNHDSEVTLGDILNNALNAGASAIAANGPYCIDPVPSSRIPVLKAIREATGINLKMSVDLLTALSENKVLLNHTQVYAINAALMSRGVKENDPFNDGRKVQVQIVCTRREHVSDWTREF